MSIADLPSTDITVKSIKTDSITFGTQGTSLSTCILIGASGTLTGPYASPPQVPALLRRYSGFVILNVAGFSANSSAAQPITWNVTLDAPPAGTMHFPIWVITNGIPTQGTCQISTTGVVTIFVGFNSPFTNSGIVGFYSFTVCYATAIL